MKNCDWRSIIQLIFQRTEFQNNSSLKLRLYISSKLSRPRSKNELDFSPFIFLCLTFCLSPFATCLLFPHIRTHSPSFSFLILHGSLSFSPHFLLSPPVLSPSPFPFPLSNCLLSTYYVSVLKENQITDLKEKKI